MFGSLSQLGGYKKRHPDICSSLSSLPAEQEPNFIICWPLITTSYSYSTVGRYLHVFHKRTSKTSKMLFWSWLTHSPSMLTLFLFIILSQSIKLQNCSPMTLSGYMVSYYPMTQFKTK